MTQAEQVMLRYNYLMQASAQQQGDFARTSWSWANQVRLLTLNIQQLAATIGQGLIAAVLPAVTALNKLFAVLQKAATAVRNFFYVLTGYKGGGSSGIVNDLASIGDASTGLEDLGSSGSDAADGLGDAAKAAEELKNATLGIDELNIISPNEPTSTGGTGGSGGGGGAGGVGGTDLGLDDGLLDLGGKEPEEYISPWAEAIRKAFLAEDWEELGGVIAYGLNRGLQKVYDVISWDNVGPKITEFTTAFTESFNSLVGNLRFDMIGRVIGAGINTIVNTFNQLFGEDGINFTLIGFKISSGLRAAIDEINWIELGKALGNYFMISWDTFLGFVNNMSVVNLETGLNGWEELGLAIADSINGAFDSISLADIGTAIGKFVAGILDLLRTAISNIEWGDIVSDLKTGISNALTAASDGGKNDGILAAVIGVGAIAGLTKIFTPIIKGIDGLSKAFGGKGLSKSIGDVLKKTTGNSGLAGAFKVIKSAIGGISAPAGLAVGAIALISGGIIDLWNTSESFRDSVSDMWDKISDAFSYAKTAIWDNTLVPLWDNISNFFGSLYTIYEESGIKDIFESIVTIIGDTLANNISGAIKLIANAFESVGGIISGLVQILSGIVEFVAGVFTGDWSKVWDGVESVVSGIVEAIGSLFSGLWESIKLIFSPVIDFFSGVFSKAKDAVMAPFEFIGTWFGERWSDIKNAFPDVKGFFKTAFDSAYKAITDTWDGIGEFFKKVANKAVSPINSLIGGIVDGVNWVSDALGVGKVLDDWKDISFASGSNGIPQNMMGIVNDQKGATYKELILPPNGKPFIPKGRNVMLPLQKGTKIMPAGQTEEFMKLMKMPRFAGGIGDFFGGAWDAIKNFAGDVWHYLTNPGDLVKIAIDKFVNLSDFFEPWLTIAGGTINTLFDSITNFVSNLFDKSTPEVNYNPSAGVEQWRELAAKALHMTGQYSESNLNLLLYQMQTESGGNPNAINNWDINAQKGTPSKGLMQVIDPTFRAYAYPGYDKNIYDPLSNILAAIRYTLSRYGSLANGWKGHGYAKGIGQITMSDLFSAIPKLAGGGVIMPGQLFVANERGPELLGRYGNRTTVVNNDQVVSSVSSGVEKAVQRQNAEMTLLLRQILETNQRILAKDTSVNLDGKRTNRLLDRAKSNAGYGFRRTVTAT